MNSSPIERTTTTPQLFRRFIIAVACLALVAVGLMLFMGLNAKPLNAKERPCVGTWAFLRPDDATTRVVYTFDPDRRVREEIYYLSSATPNVPRITMLGQWRVEKGRLLVEPAGGLTGLSDQVKGIARDALDDDERIPRPISGRIYPLQKVTTNQLIVTTSSDASGKRSTEIIMNRVK